MVSASKLASVEHKSPSHVPVLLTGDVTPEILREYENACIGYFETKDIEDGNKVRKILAGLRNTRILDWVSVNRAEIIALTFPEFMNKLRTNYLHKDWEEITRRDLMNMSQGKDSFWNFYIRLQAKNSLLRDTTSHLSQEALRFKLELGMTEELADRCRDAKVAKERSTTEWLDVVRRLDDKLTDECAKLDAKFEEFARQQRESSRKTVSLGEPSRRANQASSSNQYASNSKAPRVTLPKLTDGERKLLFDNDGCLKCRRFFVSHRAANCTNDFPSAVNYRKLTQATVDNSRRRKPSVVAAIVDDNTANTTDAPVIAVVGSSSNPVAYMPPNDSNVFKGDSDSDCSVSAESFVSAIRRISQPVAPLTMPHLYWRAMVHGSSNAFPISFKALIDHGSHIVLIGHLFLQQLGLKWRKLKEPISITVAVSNSSSKSCVTLTTVRSIRRMEIMHFASHCNPFPMRTCTARSPFPGNK
jgi:hypothetical protein